MKKDIDNYLINWKNDQFHKPLIVRGARQVGKTTAVEQLGRSFLQFVKLDFERTQELASIFQGNLDPQQLIMQIQLITKKSIVAGETLLFLTRCKHVRAH